MVKKNLYLILFLFLFSCGGVEEFQEQNNDEISFLAVTKIRKEVSSRSTVDNDWKELSDNKIGVQINGQVKQYTVDEIGIMKSDNPFYWSDFTDTKLSVSAWYPYNDGVKPEVIVYSDQTVFENYCNSDFLECETEITKETSIIEFSHAGAMIKCNITLSEQFSEDTQISEVYLYGLTGVRDNASFIKVYDKNIALVAPQEIQANTLGIGVKIGNQEIRKGILEQGLNINKGFCYTLNVTVYPQNINMEVGGSSIWQGSEETVGSQESDTVNGNEGNVNVWEGDKIDVETNGVN